MSNSKQDNAIKWLYGQAEGGKKRLAFSVAAALLSTISGVVPYYFMAKVIALLIEGERNFTLYVKFCTLMLVFFVIKSFFHAVSTKMSHGATFEILKNIRKRCTEKLAVLPLGDVLSFSAGTLKTKLVERIDEIEPILAHVIPEFTSNLLIPLLLAIMNFRINPKMGLASIITIPLGLICYLGMTIGYEGHYKRCLDAVKNLNDVTVDYINGIEVIKVFGSSQKAYEKFAAAAKESAAAPYDWMKSCNIYMTLAMIIMPATMLTVLPFGGLMYLHGNLSLIQLVTVIVYSIALVEPILTCMSYTDDMERIGTITKEIKEILDAPEMQRPAAGEMKKAVSEEGLDVCLKDVHFSYKDKEVLHGMDMEIKAGSFVALVGPSGSGKSTVAKLIASLWDVNSGEILLGGRNIKEIPLDQYNRLVSYVSQDNYLFDRTVRENIRMGCLDHEATDAEVEEVARKAGCYDFIMSLENGFDTVVGSFGGHLSGGERQRIAIARAMMKNAPVVILDEATAYTDPENEAVIQESVARLVKGKTLIVIAHRLSTVKDADCLYCIKDGLIEEKGTHQELLDKNGLYKKMWEAHIASRDE